MDSSALPAPDLDGRSTSWTWRTDTDQLTARTDPDGPPRVGGIPAGLLIDHGDHNLLILWAPVGGVRATFHLDSLSPLSIIEPVGCPTCDLAGWIHDGEWLPTASSSREASA